MNLGCILFCPGSSHLGCKQGGKEKGEREMWGWDEERGTHVLKGPVGGVYRGNFLEQTAVGPLYLRWVHA